MVKDVSYTTINRVNSLYLIINKINGYIEELHGNEYLTLVPNDESKNTLKRYEEPQIKIRYLIRSVTNILGNYKKNM